MNNSINVRNKVGVLNILTCLTFVDFSDVTLIMLMYLLIDTRDEQNVRFWTSEYNTHFPSALWNIVWWCNHVYNCDI